MQWPSGVIRCTSRHWALRTRVRTCSWAEVFPVSMQARRFTQPKVREILTWGLNGELLRWRCLGQRKFGIYFLNHHRLPSDSCQVQYRFSVYMAVGKYRSKISIKSGYSCCFFFMLFVMLFVNFITICLNKLWFTLSSNRISMLKRVGCFCAA